MFVFCVVLKALTWRKSSQIFLAKISTHYFLLSLKIKGEPTKAWGKFTDSSDLVTFLWFLDLWAFRALREGQNFSQNGQLYPTPGICLASTCTKSLVLFLVIQPQERQFQPCSFFIMQDKILSSGPTIRNTKLKQHFMLMFVFCMFFKALTWRENCITKLASDLHFDVSSFHMFSYIRLSFSRITTVIALPEFHSPFIDSLWHFLLDNVVKV